MGLSCRAVGVAEGQQSRLHQLREEDVLPDQDELCMLLSSLASVRLNPSVRLLHHTEDWNHQTCRGGKQQEDSSWVWLLLSLITAQFILHRQQHVDPIYCGQACNHFLVCVLRCLILKHFSLQSAEDVKVMMHISKLTAFYLTA